MLVSYYKGAITQKTPTKSVEVSELIELIKNSPRKEDIEELRSLKYKSKAYNALKNTLPWVSPHGVFNKWCEDKNLTQFSGLLYFDIDGIAGDLQEFKANFIERYQHKLYAFGKSVGGQGFFFYVKLQNPEKLTANNFNTVVEFVKDNIFYEYSDLLDNNAKGLARAQFIPYDSDLYVNDLNSIYIPDNVFQANKECIIRSNKCEKRKCNTPNDTLDLELLDFKDAWNSIHKETQIDFKGKDYLIEAIHTSRTYVPRIIKDGSKHTTFRAIVNSIMFNNPGVEYKTVLSIISFFNRYRVEGTAMNFKEMARTVKSEYDRIMETGEFASNIKVKKVHTNPNCKDRRSVANKAIGEAKVSRSVDAVQIVVDEMKAQGITPTINKVAEILEGRLGIATIKRHWRKVVPVIADNTETLAENATVDVQGDSEVKASGVMQSVGQVPTFDEFRKSPDNWWMSGWQIKQEYLRRFSGVN